MTDLLKTKYQWMCFGKWNVLHYIEEIEDWDDDYWELHEAQFEGERHWTAACGITNKIWAAPGIFSRMGRPRCKNCCRAIGITEGVGCPINDDTARLV